MSRGRCGALLLDGHRTPEDVRRLAQQMAEVLVGRRAPEVLRAHLTVPVREELRRLRGSMVCAMAPRLTRVFHQNLGPDGMEASAVIDCGSRARVFAFRLRREEHRWVCTRLETDRRR
ncbi:Rv3235 family protein [Nocardiopsis sp. MG754419]|uniref:Rv3235 family protein n=1 Tax=Nocardiopsis sp. MG754419 TaxID=2259865 RepID=UPI002011A86C|nr:Rv3235 family protein [Nocardiopsis sp. MG754419]